MANALSLGVLEDLGLVRFVWSCLCCVVFAARTCCCDWPDELKRKAEAETEAEGGRVAREDATAEPGRVTEPPLLLLLLPLLLLAAGVLAVVLSGEIEEVGLDRATDLAVEGRRDCCRDCPRDRLFDVSSATDKSPATLTSSSAPAPPLARPGCGLNESGSTVSAVPAPARVAARATAAAAAAAEGVVADFVSPRAPRCAKRLVLGEPTTAVRLVVDSAADGAGEEGVEASALRERGVTAGVEVRAAGGGERGTSFARICVATRRGVVLEVAAAAVAAVLNDEDEVEVWLVEEDGAGSWCLSCGVRAVMDRCTFTGRGDKEDDVDDDDDVVKDEDVASPSPGPLLRGEGRCLRGRSVSLR